MIHHPKTIMGKKKGRQSGGFGSKAKRAAWSLEWQALASEVHTTSRNRASSRGPTKQTPPTTIADRPKLRLTHVQHILQERFHYDRIEDAAHRQRSTIQKQKATVQKVQSPLVIYDNEHDEYRERGLVLLCIQSLVPVLHEYLNAMGKEALHAHLSLLPAKTLTALSVELSVRGMWTSLDLIYCVTHHAHISRLAVWLSPNKRMVDINDALLWQPLSMLLQEHHRPVPESWEDAVDEQPPQHDYFVTRRLQRLDLRNVCEIDNETPQSLVSSTGTHVSISKSLSIHSGPQFLENLPRDSLQVLDVSDCSWVTQNMLLKVQELYPNLQELCAEGCELLQEDEGGYLGRSRAVRSSWRLVVISHRDEATEHCLELCCFCPGIWICKSQRRHLSHRFQINCVFGR